MVIMLSRPCKVDSSTSNCKHLVVDSTIPELIIDLKWGIDFQSCSEIVTSIFVVLSMSQTVMKGESLSIKVSSWELKELITHTPVASSLEVDE